MHRIHKWGDEIISFENYLKAKDYYQHGKVTVYTHSINVTKMCLKIVDILHLNIDERSLVRGALLHDYFLYDWHEDGHKLHGFYHPKIALDNAIKDFDINPIEKDMILKHMFPLTIKVPRYKESVVLCIADKICAIHETLFKR